jgi:hypothetical protein
MIQHQMSNVGAQAAGQNTSSSMQPDCNPLVTEPPLTLSLGIPTLR